MQIRRATVLLISILNEILLICCLILDRIKYKVKIKPKSKNGKVSRVEEQKKSSLEWKGKRKKVLSNERKNKKNSQSFTN